MTEVLSLLNFHLASRRGDQIRGKCPLHVSENEQSRAFSANLSKNAYQCFSKKCGSKGNQLDLWIAATGLPAYESAVDLCERLGKDVPYVQLPETANRIRRTQ